MPGARAGPKGLLAQEGKPEKWVSDRHDYGLGGRMNHQSQQAGGEGSEQEGERAGPRLQIVWALWGGEGRQVRSGEVLGLSNVGVGVGAAVSVFPLISNLVPALMQDYRYIQFCLCQR